MISQPSIALTKQSVLLALGSGVGLTLVTIAQGFGAHTSTQLQFCPLFLANGSSDKRRTATHSTAVGADTTSTPTGLSTHTGVVETLQGTPLYEVLHVANTLGAPLHAAALCMERELHRLRGYGRQENNLTRVSVGQLTIANIQMKIWRQHFHSRSAQETPQSLAFRRAGRRHHAYESGGGGRKPRRPTDPVARYSPLVDIAVSPIASVLLLIGVLLRLEDARSLCPVSPLGVHTVEGSLKELEGALRRWLFAATVTPQPWCPLRPAVECEGDEDGSDAGSEDGEGGTEEQNTGSSSAVQQIRLELRRVSTARETLRTCKQNSASFASPTDGLREALHLINEAVWGVRPPEGVATLASISTASPLANMLDTPRFNHGCVLPSSSSLSSCNSYTTRSTATSVSASGWTSGSSSVASSGSLLSSPRPPQQRSPHTLGGEHRLGWWRREASQGVALDMGLLTVSPACMHFQPPPVQPVLPSPSVAVGAAIPFACGHQPEACFWWGGKAGAVVSLNDPVRCVAPVPFQAHLP